MLLWRQHYKAKQACELACKRSESSRNAKTLAPWVKEQASALLRLQWSPEQIAGKLPASHESLYLHVYADKAHGGTLWKNLRCQKQKRKRYASGRDRRGQIPIRRPLSERPAFIDKRLQVGHWECDTVIGAAHKQAIVTVVERKSGYAVMAKVSNKTADLVRRRITERWFDIPFMVSRNWRAEQAAATTLKMAAYNVCSILSVAALESLKDPMVLFHHLVGARTACVPVSIQPRLDDDRV